MRHLTPREAAELLERTPAACLIDVRSTLEFYFVGHPLDARHAPWEDGNDWERNLEFVADVLRLTGCERGRPVLLICRSGRRSVEAALALEAAGFTDVGNVLHGFEGERNAQGQRNQINGWRYDGLPWEQS